MPKTQSKEASTDSPCLICPHRDTGGNSCALLCLRLAAYNSGEDWKKEPLPYIAKQKKKKMVIQKSKLPRKARKRAEIIKLTLCKYPEIWDVVFEMATTARLPIRHVIMTLLSEAITTRQNKKKLFNKSS
jgi:hypothetical protein